MSERKPMTRSEFVKGLYVAYGLQPNPAIKEYFRDVAEYRVAAREQRAKQAARESLPRRLRWLVEHPRLLGAYWRLRPSRRPVATEQWP